MPHPPRSREAIKIKIGKPAMNRDQGYELLPSTMDLCCHVIIVKTEGEALRPEECTKHLKASH